MNFSIEKDESMTRSYQEDANLAPTNSIALSHPPESPSGSCPSDMNYYAVGPTLLPDRIATIVTDASVVTRASLRAVAFFWDLALDAAKVSTSFGLDVSRRALIRAVGAVRTRRNLSVVVPSTNGIVKLRADFHIDPFLATLDQYTAAGIYLVHHNMSMAELVALTGINLVQDSVRLSATLVDEGIKTFDGIFGSNETSRALYGFVSLVRREFSGHKCTASGGGIKTMAALTKAVVTFAIIQSATHKRSATTFKLRTLYDCTILGQADTAKWRALLLGPSKFRIVSYRDDDLSRGYEYHSLASVSQVKARASPSLQRRHAALYAAELVASPSSASNVDATTTDPETVARIQSIMDALQSVLLPDQACTAIGRLPATDDKGGFTHHNAVPPHTTNDGEEIKDPHGAVCDHQEAPTKTYSIQIVGDAKNSMAYKIISETSKVTETLEEQMRPVPHSLEAFGAGSSKANRDALDASSISNTEITLASKASQPAGCELFDRVAAQDVDRTPLRSTIGERHAVSAMVDKKRPFDEIITNSPQAVSERGTQRSIKSGSLVKRMRRRRVKTETTRTCVTMGHMASTEDGKQGAWTPRVEPSERHRLRASMTLPRNYLRRSFRAADGMDRFEIDNSECKVASNAPFVTSNPFAGSQKVMLGHNQGHLQSERSDTGSKSALPSQSSRAQDRDSVQAASSMRPIQSLSTPSAHLLRCFEDKASTNTQNKFPIPEKSLPDNLQHFMRYASATYGSHILNVFGLGESFFFKNNEQAHADDWAFAHHVDISVDDILLSSHTDDKAPSLCATRMTPIVTFVAIDRRYKAIVLACRGTIELSDLLVDLTADYQDVKFGFREGFVHRGMYATARRLALADGTVTSVLREALQANPSFGLVVVGHSLGAGVAVLAAALWASCISDVGSAVGDGEGAGADRPANTSFVTASSSGLPPGRPIHAFAFGPPATADADLARSMKGLVTTVVHHHDFIPTLSMGSVLDTRDISELLQASGLSCMAIVSRIIGLYYHKRRLSEAEGCAEGSRCRPDPLDLASNDESRVQGVSSNAFEEHSGGSPDHDHTSDHIGIETKDVKTDQEGEDWLWSLVKSLRAHAQNEKLYPPGTVYIVESHEVYVKFRGSDDEMDDRPAGEKTMAARRVILRACEDVVGRFSEPIFCRSLLRDHLPTNYEFCLDLLKKAQLQQQEEQE